MTRASGIASAASEVEVAGDLTGDISAGVAVDGDVPGAGPEDFVRLGSGEPLVPPALLTPAVKVTVVGVPKATAAGVLLVTVGAVAGLVELLAPLKVRLLSPA